MVKSLEQNIPKEQRITILAIKMTDKEICGEAMNDGDSFVIRCGLDKEHTTNHMAVISWGEENKFSYSIEEILLNGDIVMRLDDEINRVQDYLIKHGHEMPAESRRNVSLKLIDLIKIRKGDKPDD